MLRDIRVYFTDDEPPVAEIKQTDGTLDYAPIKDLSLAGLGVAPTKPHDPGELVELTFTVFDTPFHLVGKTERAGGDTVYVRFTHVPDVPRMNLEKIINMHGEYWEKT